MHSFSGYMAGMNKNDPRLNWKVQRNIHVNSESGCWDWGGTVREDGYGKYHKTYSHRLVYVALIGPIPDGLELDHLCRNRRCCNPLHLEAVTRRVNILRSPIAAPAFQRNKTACPKGHPLDGDNVRMESSNGRQWRACVTCRRAKDERRRRAVGMVEHGGKWATTHCKYGHELSGENLRIQANGWRVCRACKRDAARLRYHNKKAPVGPEGNDHGTRRQQDLGRS